VKQLQEAAVQVSEVLVAVSEALKRGAKEVASVSQAADDLLGALGRAADGVAGMHVEELDEKELEAMLGSLQGRMGEVVDFCNHALEQYTSGRQLHVR
jgi:hypothetical protein